MYDELPQNRCKGGIVSDPCKDLDRALKVSFVAVAAYPTITTTWVNGRPDTEVKVGGRK
jgi:hypothetical protein